MRFLAALAGFTLLALVAGCQSEQTSADTGSGTTIAVVTEAERDDARPASEGGEQLDEATRDEVNDPPASVALESTGKPAPEAGKTSAPEKADVENSETTAGNAESAAGKDSAESRREPAKPKQVQPVKTRSRTSQPDGQVHRITFEDLKLDMPAGTLFEPELLTDRVKQLDGQQVSLKGFILPVSIFQQTGIREFIFAMNTECKFGPEGEAFCVIPVTLPEGRETSFTIRPITVEGVLSIEPFNGPGPDDSEEATYAVYRIADAKVKH